MPRKRFRRFQIGFAPAIVSIASHPPCSHPMPLPLHAKLNTYFTVTTTNSFPPVSASLPSMPKICSRFSTLPPIPQAWQRKFATFRARTCAATSNAFLLDSRANSRCRRWPGWWGGSKRTLCPSTKRRCPSGATRHLRLQDCPCADPPCKI